MPVIRKPFPEDPHQHRQLVIKLADELTSETPTGPRILEEEQRGGFWHITVIWDEWADIAAEDRGRIIMEAYKLRRTDLLSKISVALGVTPAEAKKLGITNE
jgi:hypothetical protein